MEERWCSACGQLFSPRAQCPRQSYCSQPACQKARKLLWQKTKRHSDTDYVKNQAKASADWAKRNSDYWRRYRARPVDDTVVALSVGASTEGSPSRVVEDASSKAGRRARETRPRRTWYLVELPLGARTAVALTVAVELVRIGQTSSPAMRKETT